MALLTPEDLEDLLNKLRQSNETIKASTGKGITEICEEVYGTRPASQKVAIVPITAGNGIIGTFSSSLLAITEYFGLEGYITDHPDITGYHQAVSDGADILLMADDHMFIAHNLKNGKIAANHICTGVIYSEIASRFIHAVSKDVLVIGLGRVGYAGAEHLVKKGFNVYAYDSNTEFMEKAIEELGVNAYNSADPKKFSMVFEATPNANTISEGMISERCLVSTPGIPCALPPELAENGDIDLVMEPLVIGAAAMLYSVF
ncbi:3-methylornithyl-N6-L-lysine dehydrogenase PylD [Methanococcoides sp. SA1]|nr:3-methylornithyl-N6-L-lysine dehydrogenase PylD [Methanococcoides sp. SA1]